MMMLDTSTPCGDALMASMENKAATSTTVMTGDIATSLITNTSGTSTMMNTSPTTTATGPTGTMTTVAGTWTTSATMTTTTATTATTSMTGITTTMTGTTTTMMTDGTAQSKTPSHSFQHLLLHTPLCETRCFMKYANKKKPCLKIL